MRIEGLLMAAADTSRSRAYLQAMEQRGLLPGRVLLLPSDADGARPGQVAGEHPVEEAFDLRFDPGEPVLATLERTGVPHEALPSGDINDPATVAAFAARPEATCVYSGFGGVILRSAILAAGPRFLHVHGGWLPDYKGSTTNYYSALAQGFVAASAIFITEAIDSGPVLLRRRWPAPEDLTRLDHGLDALCRAAVLTEVLGRYIQEAAWPDSGVSNEGGGVWFVMHPVLRHAAILARGPLFGEGA